MYKRQSCGTVNSATGGLADEAYLKIISDNKTLVKETVVVTINGSKMCIRDSVTSNGTCCIGIVEVRIDVDPLIEEVLHLSLIHI